MPRKKKELTELTDDKLMGKLFHKKVRDKLKEVAHERDRKGEKQTDEKG
jgi:hypothetical protein